MKPTVSKARCRKAIRSALKIRPGAGKSETILLDMVNELVGGGVILQELRDALEWNHGEHYVRSAYNEEAEETEWFITDAGKACDIS
jgi:hypothetical protein